jgi:hypothetical protein
LHVRLGVCVRVVAVNVESAFGHDVNVLPIE